MSNITKKNNVPKGGCYTSSNINIKIDTKLVIIKSVSEALSTRFEITGLRIVRNHGGERIRRDLESQGYK